MSTGLPPDRAPAVADLAAATDILVRHLKRDRIPAVVRRTSSGLGEHSLLTLARAGDTASLLEACRSMFDFDTALA